MADTPLDDQPSARRTLTCEFCDCQLTAAGEIIKRSSRARAFIDLDDDNAKLRARIGELESQLTAARHDAAEAARRLADTPAPVTAPAGRDDDLD